MKPITNFGKLLAEIQYYESIGNDFQVERLSRLLDQARAQDKKDLTKQEEDENLCNEGHLMDEVKS